MPLFKYQASYTADSWAAQMKNPKNRVQIVGKQACEAVGGELVGGWYCFGEYDIMVICNVPDAKAMAAILGARWTAQSKAIKPEDALEVGKEHLDLLPLAA
jgi:uncharacterized protein with GYD domain